MPVRVAVVGAGKIGSAHARNYASLPGATLVALADVSDGAGALAAELKCRHVRNYRELEGQVDAVSVAVPTSLHLDVASFFLERGIHCLVEKPIAKTSEEGRRLVALADRQGVRLQVGHVERFNSAVVEAAKRVSTPLYIEADRVSPFPFRSTDVGVTLDLMIHDIDLILHLVDAPVSDVRAAGTPVLSDHEDVASARIEFATGAVANVTASRVAFKTERKMRIFSSDRYLSVDLLNRTVTCAAKREALRSGKIRLDRITPDMVKPDPLTFALQNLIEVENVSCPQANALRDELDSFVSCVKAGSAPLVTGRHGVLAIETAERILACMRRKPGGVSGA